MRTNANNVNSVIFAMMNRCVLVNANDVADVVALAEKCGETFYGGSFESRDGVLYQGIYRHAKEIRKGWCEVAEMMTTGTTCVAREHIKAFSKIVATLGIVACGGNVYKDGSQVFYVATNVCAEYLADALILGEESVWVNVRIFDDFCRVARQRGIKVAISKEATNLYDEEAYLVTL